MKPGASKRSRRLSFVPLIILWAATGIDGFNVEGSGQGASCGGLIVGGRRFAAETQHHTHDNNDETETNQTKLLRSQRQRQIRRKSIDRRPRHYWLDQSNLQKEIHQFWSNIGINTNSSSPTIPNESLLMYYERHDLRAAIVKNGGRESVSALLNGAPIMPGRWTKAVCSMVELQQLVQRDGKLSPERPPKINSTLQPTKLVDRKLWSHQNGRKKKGHWSLQTVIQELYEYTDNYQLQNNRPAVWMPRPSELAAHGRDDLRQAMHRYGGARGICRTAGMVPYREWYYFDGLLELLSELKRYLDEYADGDYSTFPTVLDIQRKGYDQLYVLIQYFGGRKFLAAKLNMSEQKDKFLQRNSNPPRKSKHPTIRRGRDNFIQFGLFDLDFAIRLLTFVRNDQMKRSPPLQSPVLSMPSRNKLLASADDGIWLDAKIDEFGGYENVARRLGLALFSTK